MMRRRRKRSRIGKGQGVCDVSIKRASATSMTNHQALIGINNGDACECMLGRVKIGRVIIKSAICLPA